MKHSTDQQHLQKYWIPRPWNYRYARHKSQAKYRGEPYELTAEEYYTAWHNSGKKDLIGKTYSCYNMKRIDTTLPWRSDNIQIIQLRESMENRLLKYYNKDYVGNDT